MHSCSRSAREFLPPSCPKRVGRHILEACHACLARSGPRLSSRRDPSQNRGPDRIGLNLSCHVLLGYGDYCCTPLVSGLRFCSFLPCHSRLRHPPSFSFSPEPGLALALGFFRLGLGLRLVLVLVLRCAGSPLLSSPPQSPIPCGLKCLVSPTSCLFFFLFFFSFPTSLPSFLFRSSRPSRPDRTSKTSGMSVLRSLHWVCAD